MTDDGVIAMYVYEIEVSRMGPQITKQAPRERIRPRVNGQRKAANPDPFDPLVDRRIVDLVSQDRYMISDLRASFRQAPDMRFYPTDLWAV